MQVSPTAPDIYRALVTFLRAVLPSGTPTRQGEVNRVPEPADTDFVVFWLILMPRLATNLDEYIDAVFTGSISGTTMTITAVNPDFSGRIKVGSTIFGVGVADGTKVVALGSGSGGLGTYTVAPSQTVGSETLAAGIETLEQASEVHIQVDVHGPQSVANAAMIGTIFRDERGVDLFAGTGITPLFADEPRQVPFLNAEQQYEVRVVVTLHLQVNFKMELPQQFADQLKVTTIEVDSTYPPSP